MVWRVWYTYAAMGGQRDYAYIDVDARLMELVWAGLCQYCCREDIPSHPNTTEAFVVTFVRATLESIAPYTPPPSPSPQPDARGSYKADKQD